MKKLGPLITFAACVGFMILLKETWPLVAFLHAPFKYLGIAPILAGAAIALAGERRFKKAGTPVRPFTEPSHLVTTGVFRRTRNPMYLGMATALAGTCILLGAVSALLPVALFIAVANLWFIRWEEKTLLAKFGKEYQDYCSQTRRWI